MDKLLILILENMILIFLSSDPLSKLPTILMQVGNCIFVDMVLCRDDVP